MATPNPPSPPLPTREQCFSLSEAQCHKILMHRDPNNERANKNWELVHQPELVRLYMTMISFPQIRDYMKQKLDYCYKTYANRYKDWHLPVDRCEREQAVRELFALVSDSSNYQTATSSLSTSASRLPIRPLQPHPNTPLPQIPQRAPYSVPTDFLFPANRQRNVRDSDQMSIATTASSATWSSGSAQSYYSHQDDTFSNPRFSISTFNSSLSSGSQVSMPPTFQGRRPLKPPKHDYRYGCWNDELRVIPCGKDHSQLRWNIPFSTCHICGFSQWHALMLQARSLDLATFTSAMISLSSECKPDFAGNHSLHFLMAAGVSMEYFTQPMTDISCRQNAFGQNPLHVLDPQDLDDDLIGFLEWFKAREHPKGLLLTQRDIKGRTPMHYLLRRPLERSMYTKILKVFPYEHHQLRTFDTNGRNALMLMKRAAAELKMKSPAEYHLLQAGIADTEQYQASGDNTQHGDRNLYGFHDIARGARGTSYLMGNFFECRICQQTNSHSNSYLDQMICACKFGRDRNGPDESGMTAAHALVTQERVNNDPEMTPETPAQTAQLLKVLIPPHDRTLREILHVLDRDGNSLVHNIAVRGLDELLQYVLGLEEQSRRRSMVNACSRSPKGHSVSVLAAVLAKIEDTIASIKVTHVTGDSRVKTNLVEKSHRLTKIKHILLREGAEVHPTITTRWQICWPS
ncbi:hypothetical protein HYFRA_00008267 [Hymenoscyphus fraxineus]|uniref:Ankyrin n=1 Tax=Hymenoscyphus fraxineus TaxID=746836 RepID=A0A9N9Q0A2_9HELO|nr:hypothetical protein HYFRA_00008267 [Hymenoscyphus fraxineus]